MVHFQRNPDGSLTIRTEVEVQVPAGASMLDAEERLMTAVNQAGTDLTGTRSRVSTFEAAGIKEPRRTPPSAG